MKKLSLTASVSLMILSSIASAQQNLNSSTCYEYHYNSVPLEIRKQQAQSIDKITTATLFSMGTLVTASGVVGFTLVKKAYPAQDTVTNLSTAGTAVVGGVAVAGVTGEIIISSVTSDFNDLMKIRNLSDEAVTGGKTLDKVADQLMQTLSETSLKIRNSKTYDRDLIKLSMSQVIIDSPELCHTQNSAEALTNIWNATLQRYQKLAER